MCFLFELFLIIKLFCCAFLSVLSCIFLICIVIYSFFFLFVVLDLVEYV